jgi:hypothetical protein
MRESKSAFWQRCEPVMGPIATKYLWRSRHTRWLGSWGFAIFTPLVVIGITDKFASSALVVAIYIVLLPSVVLPLDH